MSLDCPYLFRALSCWAILSSAPLALAESQNVLAGTKAISLVSAFVLTADAVRPGEQASKTTQITLLGPRAHQQLDQAASEQEQDPVAAEGPSPAPDDEGPPPDDDEGPSPAPGEGPSFPPVSKGASNHRANLCQSTTEVSSQKRTMVDGLKGKHLTVAVPLRGFHHIQRDQDGKWSGYDYEVLLDISKRAGFTFDLVGVDIKKGITAKEFHEKLIEMCTQYDLVLDYIQEEFFREALDIFPIYNFVDSSLVLVTNRVPSGQTSSFLTRMLVLAKPYDWEVWLVFILSCFATGGLYWFLESEGKSGVDEAEKGVDEATETVGVSVFFAMMNCSTMIGYAPRSWPGRIVFFCWSMMGVAFLAGYTANLATILVLENQHEMQWAGIEDAIKDEAKICVSRAGASGRFMSRHYPGYTNTVEAGFDKSPIKKMVKGKCDAAIVWKDAYDIAILKEEYNSDCLIQKIGPNLNQKKAGWTAFADYNDRCTVIVRDVIHTYMQEMFEDGSLDGHFEKLLSDEKTIKSKCSARQEPSATLGLRHMSGLFLLNLTGAGVACVLYFLHKKAAHHVSGAISRITSSNREVVQQDASS